ncbi:hypothetical protein FGO68_gene13612 [Halteria grandinella]|uniref:Uncharacterized protein n=1 Tax=Halteria grandinella TaxID=5974 RepID=A0A8J8NTK5_HALGN|nr:hypothetical protein FGO68_gene13612 [Halteria grandinella]
MNYTREEHDFQDNYQADSPPSYLYQMHTLGIYFGSDQDDQKRYYLFQTSNIFSDESNSQPSNALPSVPQLTTCSTRRGDHEMHQQQQLEESKEEKQQYGNDVENGMSESSTDVQVYYLEPAEKERQRESMELQMVKPSRFKVVDRAHSQIDYKVEGEDQSNNNNNKSIKSCAASKPIPITLNDDYSQNTTLDAPSPLIPVAVSGEDTTTMLLRQILQRLNSLEYSMISIKDRMTSIEGSMTSIENRMSSIEGRMTTIEGRMATIEGRMTTIEGRMTTIEGRMATLEGRMTLIEARMDKVESDIQTLRHVQHLSKQFPDPLIPSGYINYHSQEQHKIADQDKIVLFIKHKLPLLKAPPSHDLHYIGCSQNRASLDSYNRSEEYLNSRTCTNMNDGYINASFKEESKEVNCSSNSPDLSSISKKYNYGHGDQIEELPHGLGCIPFQRHPDDEQRGRFHVRHTLQTTQGLCVNYPFIHAVCHFSQSNLHQHLCHYQQITKGSLSEMMIFTLLDTALLESLRVGIFASDRHCEAEVHPQQHAPEKISAIKISKIIIQQNDLGEKYKQL